MAPKTITKEDVEMWLYTLSNNNLDEMATRFMLKNEPDRFSKLAKIHKWIRGDYSEADFIEDKDLPYDKTLEYRLNARHALLQSYCNERSSDTIIDPNVTQYDCNPLLFYLKTEVKPSDENRVGKEQTQRVCPKQKQNKNTERDDADSVTSDDSQSQTNNWMVAFEKMQDMMLTMATRIDQMSATINIQSNAGSSSTRQESQVLSPHVRLQDTFTVHNISSNEPRGNERNPTCSTPYQAQQRAPTNRHVSWRGGGVMSIL